MTQEKLGLITVEKIKSNNKELKKVKQNNVTTT
jgi:hypothetical protein